MHNCTRGLTERRPGDAAQPAQRGLPRPHPRIHDNNGGIAVALVQVAQALAEPADRRTTSTYGDFAWLRPQPEDAQRRFPRKHAAGGPLAPITMADFPPM